MLPSRSLSFARTAALALLLSIPPSSMASAQDATPSQDQPPAAQETPPAPAPDAAPPPASTEPATPAPAPETAAPAAPPVPEAAPAPAASAPEQKRHHALSLIDPPRFPADFKHFDWVNPDAPKGGTVRLAVEGTFDSLNPFSIKGVPAGAVGLIYDSLMAQSPDEESVEYGLIAEWISFPDDYSSATFKLRPEARFHDGQPITPEDVIWSLEALKKAHPHYARYYKNVVKAEKTGDHEVQFTFDSKGNRELPHILGQLNVLPKHYWEAKGANGEQRDLAKSTLEVPVGSGPYKIKDMQTASRIVLERVKDYWAKDLPVSKGQWNFDEIRFQYFRDRVATFEEFKSGKADYWRENTARAWATQFDFDAIRKGLVKKETFPTAGVARMQAFVLNTRRKQFQDPRVRQAFNLAFNFEGLNRSILYEQYQRVGSFFDNSELKATGLPEGRELEILKPFEKDVPAEVFTTEWKNPVNGSNEDLRKHLQQAVDLLKAAGWEIRNETVDDPDCGVFCRAMRAVGLGSERTRSVLRNAAGEPLTAEFLLQSEAFQPHVAQYISNLEKIGIGATVRVVDSAQYEQRETNFDYDIVIGGFPQSLSPGNEQRDFWGTAAADHPGSRNLVGIKNPVIDALIEKIVFATDRADLVAATKALDRVLLWNFYVVPQWHNPNEWVATWDVFGRPGKLPSQTHAFTQVWWIDPAKQQALGGARATQ